MDRPKLTETGRWREWPPASDRWAWYEPWEEKEMVAVGEAARAAGATEGLTGADLKERVRRELGFAHAMRVDFDGVRRPEDDAD